jgi:ribosomal protein S12 methylthiotransferase accessory factor
MTAALLASCAAMVPLITERITELGVDSVDVMVGPLGASDQLSGVPRRQMDGAAAGSAPVQVCGQTVIVGPLARRGEPGPGCAHCVARRWQALRSSALREALESDGRTESAGEWPYLTPFVTHALAAVIVAATCHGPEPAGYPYVYLLDTHTLTVERYPLVPDESCPSCGHEEFAARPGFELTSSPKRGRTSFRSRKARDYHLPLDAFVNPICGILGRGVSRLHGSPTTASAKGRFEVRTATQLHEIYWGGNADNYRDSVAIGMLEALERATSARPRAAIVDRVTSLAALRAAGERAVDPVVCGLYPGEYYDAERNVSPFAESEDITWVGGYSLRDHVPVLVPEVLTYYYSAPVRERFVQECSNGCASGGSLIEASYFGLMELIERDAFLLSWYGGVPLPEIDPHSVADPAVRQMVDRLDMYGYRARFFDGRMTFSIPVVVGVAVRKDGGIGTLCFGGGASLDPVSALRAALAEIATDALALRLRTERDFRRLTAMANDFELVGAIHDHSMMYGLPEMRCHASFLIDQPRSPAGVADVFESVPPPAMDLRDDLEWCVNLLSASGFDVIIVDQTSPVQRSVGAYTVSVVVPGLLPIDFGWRRQRAPLMPRMHGVLRSWGQAADSTQAGLHLVPHPYP